MGSVKLAKKEKPSEENINLETVPEQRGIFRNKSNNPFQQGEKAEGVKKANTSYQLQVPNRGIGLFNSRSGEPVYMRDNSNLYSSCNQNPREKKGLFGGRFANAPINNLNHSRFNTQENFPKPRNSNIALGAPFGFGNNVTSGGGLFGARTSTFNAFGGPQKTNLKNVKDQPGKDPKKSPGDMNQTSEYIENCFFFKNNKFTKIFLYKRLISYVIAKEGDIAGFLDADFILATASPTEMIFMLSIMDLSFCHNNPIIKNNMITSQHNGVLFSKKFVETSGTIKKSEIIISQRFYHKKEKDLKGQDHPVEEFIKGQIYMSRVVITNCSAKDEEINIVSEVPQGSIPINRTETLQALPITIPSFQSRILAFSFYFPESGEFKIYPACVTRKNQILAISDISTDLTVKSQYENQVFHSMWDIQLRGTVKNYFEFLDKIDYSKKLTFFKNIKYVLTNKHLWEKTMQIIREKGIFNEDLWVYGILHKDVQATKEYFQYKVKHISGVFYLKSELIDIDNWTTSDFFPLQNARTHSKNPKKENILNLQFKEKYTQYLNYLLDKKYLGRIRNDDWLVLVTYLLLQDRIQESLQIFRKIEQGEKEDPVTNVIQRDYIEAYLDFLDGYPDFKRSKELCVKYLSYPILSWRNLFVEIANQLAEFENKDFESTEVWSINDKVNKASLEAKMPFLEAEMKENKIQINYKNQSRVHVEFYLIDLEILFSEDPFEEKMDLWLAKVMPCKEMTCPFTYSQDLKTEDINIPEEYQMKNLLLRIKDDSSNFVYLKYIPFSLAYSINEELAILKLVQKDTSKPMPKIYVKCYVKMKNNKVVFMKDGYTDLRGSFEYNYNNMVDKVHSFSILVISPEYGAKIFKIKSTNIVEKKKFRAKKILSHNWRKLGTTKAQNNHYSQAMMSMF
jgi:hypothetical protein